MAENKLNAAQLLSLARQLKSRQDLSQEGEAIEQLAKTGISETQQEQLHDLMQDKAKLARVLQSPQAQALMQKLNGKKE